MNKTTCYLVLYFLLFNCAKYGYLIIAANIASCTFQHVTYVCLKRNSTEHVSLEINI